MLFLLFGSLLIFLIIVILFRTVGFSRQFGESRQHLTDDVNIDEAAGRLSKAIRYQTVSNQDLGDINEVAFADMHRFLEKAFPKIHNQLEKEVVNDYSLLYTWKGSDPDLKPVMLTSHLDVVPVEPGTEEEWSHPPFDGVISGGYIWGRGAMDVQGGVLGILEAIEWLLDSGFRPQRTIILGFGHDEEIDGHRGASEIGKLLKQRGVSLEYLLDEGTPIVHNMLPELQDPVALVAVAEKGYLSLELTAKSEGGHSSVPQGLTSIARLGKALHKLESNPIKGGVDGLVQRTMEAIGPHMSIPYRVVMANLWLFGSLVKRELSRMPATKAALTTTVATTIFESGIKENVLPTQARAIVNFRIHPNDTLQSVIDYVKKTVDDPDIEIRLLEGAINPSHVSDVNQPAYQALKRSILEVFPEVVVAPTLMIGATDARHYSELSDNIFRFIPLRAVESDLDRVHGTDERISQKNYHEMISFYTRLLKNTTA